MEVFIAYVRTITISLALTHPCKTPLSPESHSHCLISLQRLNATQCGGNIDCHMAAPKMRSISPPSQMTNKGTLLGSLSNVLPPSHF